MTDDLVKRHIEQLRLTGGDLGDLCQPLADAIEALTKERDRLREAGEKAICHITGYGEASTARIELRAALKGETP